jgi:hypothetical protein
MLKVLIILLSIALLIPYQPISALPFKSGTERFDAAMIGVYGSYLPKRSLPSVELNDSIMLYGNIDFVVNNNEAVSLGVGFITRKSSPNDFQIVVAQLGYKWFWDRFGQLFYSGVYGNGYVSRYVALGHFNSISQAEISFGGEVFTGVLLPFFDVKRQYVDLRLSYQFRPIPVSISSSGGEAHLENDHGFVASAGYYF